MFSFPFATESCWRIGVSSGEVVLRGKPSGRSRWAGGSKAARADPKGTHSNSRGLTELLRLYGYGLPPRPSSRVS
jgi:hypothetical protein